MFIVDFRNLGFSCMNYVFINPTVQTTPSASATHRLALSLQGKVLFPTSDVESEYRLQLIFIPFDLSRKILRFACRRRSARQEEAYEIITATFLFLSHGLWGVTGTGCLHSIFFFTYSSTLGLSRFGFYKFCKTSCTEVCIPLY